MDRKIEMVHFDLQNPDQFVLPAEELIQTWINISLSEMGKYEAIEVTLRIVGQREGMEIAKKFCKKDRATNVLSFTFGSNFVLPEICEIQLLGDIVICMPVVQSEAIEMNISNEQHLAHLCVHGILHLLGMDHKIAPEARDMELMETNILNKLGFPNPYDQQIKDGPSE